MLARKRRFRLRKNFVELQMGPSYTKNLSEHFKKKQFAQKDNINTEFYNNVRYQVYNISVVQST